MTRNTKLLGFAAISLGVASTVALATDGRIPVYNGATTIAAPGSYYLTEDITIMGTPTIAINSGDVTLDLNGHLVMGDIQLGPGGFSDIVIKNGNVMQGNIDVNNGASRMHVERVIMKRGAGPGGNILFGPSSDIAVEHCKANTINFVQAWNGSITHCLMYSGLGGPGILVANSRNIEILYNSVQLQAGIGIYVVSSRGTIVSYNDVSQNNGDGILCGMSSGNEISRNNVSENIGHGIELQMSNYCQVVDNTVTLNSTSGSGMPADGIRIDGQANGHDVTRNTVAENEGNGIHLTDMLGGNVAYNRLTQNTVSRNGAHGISLNAMGGATVINNSLDWNHVAGNTIDGFYFSPMTMWNVYGNNRSRGNGGLQYNDLSIGGANTSIFYDGPAMTAPTNN